MFKLFKPSRSILTSTQLADIGIIVTESAYIELIVEDMIGELASLNKDRRDILMGRAMLNAKLEIFQALGEPKLKSKKRKKQFNKIIQELKDSNSIRINAVHGEWAPIYKTPPKGLREGIWNIGEAQATHKGSTLKASSLANSVKKLLEAKAALNGFVVDVWIVPGIMKSVYRIRATNRARQKALLSLQNRNNAT
jgi:hypothetical protein